MWTKYLFQFFGTILGDDKQKREIIIRDGFLKKADSPCPPTEIVLNMINGAE